MTFAGRQLSGFLERNFGTACTFDQYATCHSSSMSSHKFLPCLVLLVLLIGLNWDQLLRRWSLQNMAPCFWHGVLHLTCVSMLWALAKWPIKWFCDACTHDKNYRPNVVAVPFKCVIVEYVNGSTNAGRCCRKWCAMFCVMSSGILKGLVPTIPLFFLSET